MDDLGVQLLAFTKAQLADTVGGAQELEAIFQQLLLLRSLDTAAGEQLDGIGQIAGLLRAGRTDEEYRDALDVKFKINISRGTVPEILDIVASLDGVTDVRVIEERGSIVVYIYGTALTHGQRVQIMDLAREAIYASVASAETSTPLVCGPDGGWHVIQSMSDGTTVVLDYSAAPFFLPGESVRIWRFTSQESIHETTVVSTSGANVTLLDTVGAGYADFAVATILENVSRGVQDDEGCGTTDVFAISAASSSDGTITITGDVRSYFPAASLVRIDDSTGNDGNYKIASSVLDNGDTVLWMETAVADDTGDGTIYQIDPLFGAYIDSALLDGVEYEIGSLAEVYSPP